MLLVDSINPTSHVYTSQCQYSTLRPGHSGNIREEPPPNTYLYIELHIELYIDVVLAICIELKKHVEPPGGQGPGAGALSHPQGRAHGRR